LRAICVWALALAGCAASNQTPLPGQAGRTPTPAVFATQLAGPGTYLAPMPTAVVLLKPDDMARNRAFCTAFVRLPTATEAMNVSVVAPNVILTRWLTQLREVPSGRERDCEFLAGTYDYARAAALAAAVRADQGSLAGRGPYLLLVVPDPAGLRVVGVDGSAYREEDFDRFVASWGTAVNNVQARYAAAPDMPGVVRSAVMLVASVLRAVFAGAAGLIQGVVGNV
jgi:hypothetical protein